MNIMKKDMWRIETEQVLGTPNGSFWSQVHHFLPAEGEKRKQKGELLLLVSLRNAGETGDLYVLGREIISRFHEEYFTPQGKIMDCLKDALVKVGQEKSQYFENPKELSLLSLVLWQNIVYLGIWHQGRVLLRRGGKTITIASGKEKESTLMSGMVEENDFFLMATEDFFQNIPEGMITASMVTEELETIAEALTPVVHAKEKQGSLAAVVVKISQKLTVKENLVEPLPKMAIERKTLDLSMLRRKLPKIKFGLLGKIKPRKIKVKNPILTLAFGFLFLLGISLFFGWQKRHKEQQATKIAELSSQIEEKLRSVSAIKNLDPESSLKLIGEAGLIADQLDAFDSLKAGSYRSQIETMKLGLGEEAIEPELFYDLNLLGDGVKVKDTFLSEEKLIVLDGNGKRVMMVDLLKKSGEIIAGGEDLSGQRLVVYSNDRTYLVNENISLLKDKKLSEVATIVKESEIIAASGWLGGLYLLDEKNEQIWKYPATESGLGKGEKWLVTEIGFSFDLAADFDIDGSVWLLLENGRIYKFLRGDKEKFDQQLPSGIGKAKFLAVSKSSETVIFWDEEKKIVWVFGKNGEFLSRIPLKLDEIEDLAISEEGKDIFLITADKIYLLKI